MPQRDEMTCSQVSGLVFTKVLLALNLTFFFFPAVPRSFELVGFLLSSRQAGTKSIYSYLAVESTEPNTVIGIEDILSIC